MNLVYHESNYDLRGQILRHLNTASLSQIVNQYFTAKPIENNKYYIEQKLDKTKKGSNNQSLIAYNRNNIS